MSTTLSLLDLPLELILASILYLSSGDIQNLLQVNRLLHRIISESVEIQYLAAQERAGVEENPQALSQLSISERLTQLKEREQRWLDFQPLSRHNISIPLLNTGTWSIQDDILVVTHQEPDVPYRDRTCISAVYLSDPGNTEWRGVYRSGKSILVFGLAVADHDLIAIVTGSSDPLDPSLWSLDIQLLQFSSGSLHPLASRPLIHLQRDPVELEEPDVNIEIVGGNMAVCVCYDDDEAGEGQLRSFLYVYSWQTGELVRTPLPVMCSDFLFLSEDILLIPSVSSPSLQILHIRASADPLVQLLLPEFLQQQYSLRWDSFRFFRRPHPMQSPPLHLSSRFRPSPETAVIVVFFSVESNASRQHYRLVIPRLPLLEHFLHALHTAPTNVLVSQLLWSDWGQKSTRFLQSTEVPANDITMSTLGQRLVSIGRHMGPTPIHVLDFNPHAVRRSSVEPHSQGNSSHRVVDSRAIAPGELSDTALAVFEPSQVENPQLAYVHSKSTELFHYDAVELTNENVVGIKVDGSYNLKSLEVLHFG
ncbi:hypothetical protein C8F01DRAFT_284533 [Mycena amicta]|nr:hypothetical protein C8F01DRAFT_284533 [Mycena amicta]